MIDDHDRCVDECFFWYQLTQVVPDKIQGAVKWLCVCVCVHACVHVCVRYSPLGFCLGPPAPADLCFTSVRLFFYLGPVSSQNPQMDGWGMLRTFRVWCSFDIPSLDSLPHPHIFGEMGKCPKLCQKMWSCPHLGVIVTKWRNIGKQKINLHTRDDRPTFWYKICKLLLIQFLWCVMHCWG